MGNGVERYGGFDLRRGDHDPRDGRPATWGGAERPAGEAGEHVATLQQDLAELGFHLVGGADGGFGRRTFWALREFQIYARFPRVAREDLGADVARYADRLSPVATGDHAYDGPISGVADAATRSALVHWRENAWRCPVVIEAWTRRDGARHVLRSGNLWLHDELASSLPRMYALDLSDSYGEVDDELQDGGLVVLGDFQKYLDWSGPRSAPPRHTWPHGELSPEALTGKSLDQLDAAERSTYKVVRAVSEVECLAFFDSVNSYDNAFVSAGPCHWTLGIVNSNRTVSDGELCAFLAYLRHADPEAFEQAVGRYGVRPDREWTAADGVASGKPCYVSSLRKYAGWLSLEQADGSFEKLAKSEAEGDYFKTWHWFYRFVMAGRTIDGYRRAMWDLARVRLRDVLDVPWQANVANVAAEGGRAPAIGDVLTSERAVAMVLRWHIRAPAQIVVSGREGSVLRQALDRARDRRDDLIGDPTAWGDPQESALLEALREIAEESNTGGIADTIAQVDAWPSWTGGNNSRGYRLDPTIGSLAETRGSFRLDLGALPPAP